MTAQEAIRLFNAHDASVRDDIKTSLCPPSFIKIPEQLVAYYARHVYTLAEEAVFMMQRSQCAVRRFDPTGYHFMGNQ